MALAVFVVPLAGSVLAAVLVSRQLPAARSWQQLALWWVVLGVVATAVLVVVDRIVVRLIPIDALHQLSALFPERGVGRRRAAKLTEQSLEDLPEPPGHADEDVTASLRAMLHRLERHDPKTAGHASRVRRYSDLIAEELEVASEDRHKLAWAALVHDVGKLTVAERTLARSGELAPDELLAVREHPEQSRALTSALHPWLGEWALAIGQHHERWDGSGYPQGLRGEGISLGARVLAVADTFDALVGPRSYKPTISPQAARQVIAEGAGTHFDPTVVRAFLNVSIRRLRVVSGGLTWGLQSRATGLLDTAARLATTGTAIVAAGTALAIGGQLELPRLDLGATEVGLDEPDATNTEAIGTAEPTEGEDGQPAPGATAAPADPDGSAQEQGGAGPPGVVPVGPVVPGGPPTSAPTATPTTPPTEGPVAPTPAPGLLAARWASTSPFGSTLRPTETVALTVVLTNTGPGRVESAVATLRAPGELRGIPGSLTVDGVALPGAGFGGAVALPELDPGGTVTISATLETPPDAVSGPVGPPSLGTSGPAGATTFTAPGGYVIDADPDVTWSVVATPSSGGAVLPGSRVTFRATVENGAEAGGQADALSVAVALPTGLTPDPASVRLDGAARSVSALASGLGLPAIPPGERAVLVFAALVDRPFPDGSVLTTVTTLRGLVDGAQTVVTSHVVDAMSAVTLSAAAVPVGPVSPGGTITYTFDVANDAAATATATGLVLTVPTPARSTYLPGSTTLDGAAVPDASNPLAAGLSLPALAPGDAARVTISVRVASPLENGVQVTATATVVGAVTPLTASVRRTVSSAPSLDLTLVADRDPAVPLLPGDVLTYTLTLRNAPTATATARGARMSLPTPTNATYVAASAVDASGASVPGGTNPFAGPVAVPDLAPGATARLRISVEVVAGLPAGATVTATGTGSATGTFGLTRTTTHTVASTTDVVATLSAAPPDGASVTPGDTVVMTLTVSNGATATAIATGLATTAITSTGLSAVPGTTTLDGLPVAASPGTSPIALPDLAPGDSTVLRWQAAVARPLPNGTVLGTTTSVTGDALAAIDTTVEHTVASAPDLTLSIAADRPTSTAVVPGDTLTYTVMFANSATATETATGTTLRLPTPAGTSFVPGSAVLPDGTTSPSATNPFVAPISVPALAPGDTAAISVDVVVNAPRPNGSALTASSTADATQLTTPITRTVTHTISSAPIIGLAVDPTPLPSSTVLAGSTITYRVAVTNDAAATENAVGLDVTIPTPQSTTFVSAVDETGATLLGATNPFASGRPLPTLAPGGSHTLELTVRVDTPLANGTLIQQVTSLDAVRLATPVTATREHVTLSDPAVTVVVEATPDPATAVTPGTVITYAVTAANSSVATATATGVTLIAPDPVEATYVDDSAVDETGSPMAGTTVNPFATGYALPDLAPGDVRSVSFQVVLDSPLPDGTVVRQSSEVDSTELVLPVRDFVEHTITSAPALSLDLRSVPTAGTTLTPGDSVRYLATVANFTAGTATATGVVVTIPTPTRTTYVDGSAVDEAGTSIPGPAQPFATGYPLPDLAPGDAVTVELEVRLDTPLPDGVSIAASGSLDADQIGTPLSDAITHPVASSITLSVDLTSVPAEGGAVTPGDTITYRAQVTNLGGATATATGVSVTIPTPADTTYVPGSARDENGDPIGGAANPFATGWSLPDLAPGDSATVLLDAQVDRPLADGTPLEASATADADQAPAPVVDTAGHTVSAAVDLAFSVIATPSASTTVMTGSTITYRLRVTNGAGATATATGLSVTAPTPSDTTYVPDSARDETGATVTGPDPFAGGFGLPPLAPSAAWEVSFTATVDSPLPDGTVVMLVAGLDADQLATTTTVPVSHTVSSAVALAVELTAVPVEGGPVSPGATVSYTLTVANDVSAGETATGLVATIPTPADTVYAPGSAVDESGTTITGSANPFAAGYALPDLAPGGTWTLAFDAVVDTPLPNGTALTTTATLDATQLPTALTDAASHTVASAPSLSVTVQSSPAEGGTVAPGDTVTYELTVTNDISATAVATGVAATLPVPADTAFVAGSAIDETGAPLPEATNPFATGWALPDLAPGGSWTLRIQVTIDRPLPNGTVIDLQGAADADQLAVPVTDGAPLTVVSSPVPTVALSTTPPQSEPLRPTRTITYVVTVGNEATADAVATSATVTLPTPIGTSYVDGSARDENGDPVLGAVNPFAAGYTLPDLAPGDTATVSVDVTVEPGVITGDTIDQLATLGLAELPGPFTDASSHPIVVHENSPFHDQVTVSEVFYDALGPTLIDNDEAVELRNLTASPIDVSGWTVADVDVLGTQVDTTGTFTAVLPVGTVIPAYGHLVIWLGVDQSATRPGFTNLIGSLTPEVWLGTTPALDATTGDDLWIYDPDLAVVDRVAFGSGAEIAPAPPAGTAPWDPVSQTTLLGATRSSVATTPSTSPTRSSACVEVSTSGAAAGDPVLCPDAPVTRDTDAWPGRVSSLGDPNTFESPLRGQVAITEVLFRETGGLPIIGGNDEAVEIRNVSAVPVDLSGWTIADHDVVAGAESSSFTYTFGGGSVLAPGGIAVVWTGTNRILSLPGFTNVGAEIERYVEGGTVLDDTSDDLWLFDPSSLAVDFVGWGSPAGSQRSPLPRAGFWNPVSEASFVPISTGRTISVTPGSADADTSACWEQTASGAASGDPLGCPTPPATRDTDGYGGRVTSLGDPNS